MLILKNGSRNYFDNNVFAEANYLIKNVISSLLKEMSKSSAGDRITLQFVQLTDGTGWPQPLCATHRLVSPRFVLKYLDAPSFFFFFSRRSPINSRHTSGVCDRCKWEEKAILPDTWHASLMQGDRCRPSRCVSFLSIAQITRVHFPIFLYPPSGHIQPRNRRGVAATPCSQLSWPPRSRLCYRVTCDVIWLPALSVTDLQPPQNSDDDIWLFVQPDPAETCELCSSISVRRVVI